MKRSASVSALMAARHAAGFFLGAALIACCCVISSGVALAQVSYVAGNGTYDRSNSSGGCNSMDGGTCTDNDGNSPAIIDKPPGLADGDVLIASIALEYGSGTAPTITAPAGWTQVPTLGNTQTSGQDFILYTYYRVVTSASGEPASYSWSFSENSNPLAGAILAFRGVDNTTPLDVAAGSTVGPTSDSTDAIAPSLTPVTTNSMLLTVHAMAKDASMSWTPRNSIIERADVYSRESDSHRVSLSMNTVANLTAGTATGTRTARNSQSGRWIAQSLILRRASLSVNCTSQATGNWNVAATWTNCRGGIPLAGDSVTVANSHVVTLNVNSPALSTLTVNNGGTLTASGSYTLTTSGNATNGGAINGGSGTMSIGGNLTNSGTLTAGSGAITVSGTLTNGSGATFTGSGNLSVSGAFSNSGTFSSGNGTVTFSNVFENASGSYTGGSGNVSLAGNFSNSAAFTSGTGTWTFNGSSAQSIVGTVAFDRLTLNNANSLLLSNDVTVGTVLAFSNGKIITGANALIVTPSCMTAGSITGYGSDRYVNGNLRLTFPAGVSNCTYPVGDSEGYGPIAVATSVSSPGGTLTGSSFHGQAPNFWNSGVDATQFVNRYWTLGMRVGDTLTSMAAGSTYDVTLQFPSAEVSTGATVSTFQVALFSNAWSPLGGAAGGANGTTATTAKLTGQTTFGRYVVGKALAACDPPSNIPAGVSVTCTCDNFARQDLNPSPIFGGNWLVSAGKGTFIPSIVTSGRMKLTQNVGNQATAATVPGIFPASGNYISVEFKHYAYGSSSSGSICGSSQTGNCSGHPTTGADGIVITLSDYAVPAQPGAYGGSLGYAQLIDPAHPLVGQSYTQNGFAGGWAGIALDEWGNYQNGTEGRVGGKPYGSSTAGNYYESVGARGSGSGLTGYRWFAGTTSLSPRVDNSSSGSAAPGYSYQVVVDARNYPTNGTTGFSVNRDTGTGYTSLINIPDIFSTAQNLTSPNVPFVQDPVPTNWQISFTAGTGGANNTHEIAGLKVCAQNVFAPTAGNSASPLNAIDEAYALPVLYPTAVQGHIYTKVADVPFKLGVIAFSGNQVNTPYTGDVDVQLIDDSVGTSCNASAAACSSCAKPVLATQTVTFTGNATGQTKGEVQTGNFTLDSAYSRVIVRMSDETNTGCSTNAFTVRPASFSSVTSTATNSGLTGTPMFKAGTDAFNLTVSTATTNYTGTPQINPTGVVAGPTSAGGWTVGSFSATTFPAAIGSSASGSFTYSEVGNFTFLGYAPASDASSVRGIADESWVALSTAGTPAGSGDFMDGDCVAGGYSNTKDANGKYGCNFGITANVGVFGRFVPDHFQLTSSSITAGVATGTPSFTYMGAPKLGIQYTLSACAGAAPACAVTQNYDSGKYSAAAGPTLALPAMVAEDGAYPSYDLAGRISLSPAAPTAWTAGQYSVNASASTFSLPGTRPGGSPATSIANAGGAFDSLTLGVKMTDADGTPIDGTDMNAATSGACSGSGPGCDAKSIGTTSIRQGRLVLDSGYGSELLTLPVRVSAQYFSYDPVSSTGTWKTNTADTGAGATTIPAGAAVLSNFVARGGGDAPTVCFRNVASCTAIAGQLSPSSVTLANGRGTFNLYDGNGKQGTADMTINLGAAGTDGSCNTEHKATTAGVAATWLRYLWCNGTLHDPNARIKFGSSKAPYIYMREMY